MSVDDKDNMMSRWAKRKQAVAQEEQVEQQLEQDAVEAKELENLEELPEEEVLERLGLPNPDGMKKGDDFKPFMQKGVPGYLRKRALRTLWGSNPILANVDGLVDYGEDFTDAAMVPDVINTLYTVGKGMVQKVLDPEDIDSDAVSVETAETTDSDEKTGKIQNVRKPDENNQVISDSEPEIAEQTSLESAAPTQTGDLNPTVLVRRPRRMQFDT